MRYTSTRSKDISCSFEEALCSGYAPDGGLFVPEYLPTITIQHLEDWSKLSYADLLYSVLRLFIDSSEISDDDLHWISFKALEGFENPEHAVPVVAVGPLFVAELFRGPTFCFKDLGMRILISLLSIFAKKRQRKISLLVATTGDTGPAAARAVADANNPLLTILIHYPLGQISEFQRKQLTTVNSPYVRISAFEGGGDDMDKPIKNLITGHMMNAEEDSIWTGINSYNIGRPIAQMTHFIWTYLRVTEQKSDVVSLGDPAKPIDIIVPTGAMGNIASGYMVKKMGLPLRKLNAGVNANDITDRVIQTGQFHRSEKMIDTLSGAINIQIPYNFERLLYYLTDENHNLVSSWMCKLDNTAKIDLDRGWLNKLQLDFDSARVTDDEMCAAIRNAKKKYDYLADPHTAVAFVAAEKLGYWNLESMKDDEYQDSSNAIATALLATASPCKFEESMTVAIGEEKWKEYFENKSDKYCYPLAAKTILTKTEESPIIYKAEGMNLNQSQIKWESMARKIMEEL